MPDAASGAPRAGAGSGPDFEALLHALPDPVVILSSDARLAWANRPASEWSGWDLDEWVGRSAADLVHPDDLPLALSALETVQGKEIGTPVDVRLQDHSGAYHRFEVRGRSALDDDRVRGVVLVLRDVTERRRWEIAHGQQDVLQAILDHAPAITMLLDAEGRIRSASRALTTVLGHDPETAAGQPLHDLAAPHEARWVREGVLAVAAGARDHTFEAAFPHASGERQVPLNITVVNLLDDLVVEGLVATAVDITALVEARARLRHLATHDSLTGLPNRGLFLDRLRQALAGGRRRGTVVGLVFGDLDDFKAINDQHGHAAGDAVLVEVARRLRGCVRDVDTVARIGGDEFVMIVEDGHELVELVVQRIEHAFREPVVLPSGVTVSVRMSCGMTSASDDATVESLLNVADAAMYGAKRKD